MQNNQQDQDQDFGTCSCGEPAVKFSSGRPECWKCWNWRKLDGPAARHWAEVSTQFLSNVDMYDLSNYFGQCGVSLEEAKTMLRAAAKIRDTSKAMLDAHTNDN